MGEKKPLSKRKRKYVKGVVQGKTKKQAALDAGYSESVALKAAEKIETPNVHAAFQKLIREAIPEKKLVQRLAEGIDAMETEFAKFEGQITDTKEVIAWGERREYIKLAAQYGGYVPKEQPDVIVPVQIIVDL
jgi:phage terminase small subunit